MDYIKDLRKLITGLAPRHDTFTVFSDFIAMAAIAISNAIDAPQGPAREAEYMRRIARYNPDEIAAFPKMLGTLTTALEDDMADILGRLFHELELANKWKGQFFTPDSVCRLMAAMTLTGEIKDTIERRGFIHANEPCIGAGAMVIALARALKAQGINYQQTLHVTAVDIDIRALHMAYLQLSLLQVPAVIIHGNTLSLEQWDHWHTPARILGGWKQRLAIHALLDPKPEALLTCERPRKPEPGQLELF